MPQYPNIVSTAFARSFYGVDVIPPVPVTGAPVVNPATFDLSLPTTTNHAIGTVTASNTPTSWSLSNNTAGYYAISSGGALTVTAAGATGITPGTDYVYVTATNADGSGSAWVGIEAS